MPIPAAPLLCGCGTSQELSPPAFWFNAGCRWAIIGRSAAKQVELSVSHEPAGGHSRHRRSISGARYAARGLVPLRPSRIALLALRNCSRWGIKSSWIPTRPGSPAFADMRVLAGAGYIVADLAWTRLTRIRELLAQLLDGHDLTGIRAVTILYCGADPSPAAKYMQAWLRSEIDFRSRWICGKTVPDGRGRNQSRFKSHPTSTYVFPRNCAEYETGALHQRANLTSCAEDELLSEELSIMSRDPAFERALQRMTIWTPRS